MEALQHNKEWQEQMAESVDRFARGDVGEPVEAEDIHEWMHREVQRILAEKP